MASYHSDNDANGEGEIENIAQEYETWKQNCSTMYQFVAESVLTWPSLTVQWLPEVRDSQDQTHQTQQILVGTYSAGASEEEFVEIGEIDLPNFKSKTANTSARVDSRVRIVTKMAHVGEPNRARYQWQDANVVATSSTSGTVYIYDQVKGGVVGELVGHTESGYGVAWNPVHKGILASCSDDGSVAVWDTNTLATGSTTKISPVKLFTDHKGIVNDVAWHKTGSLFGSVAEDCCTKIYDYRTLELSSQSTDEKANNSLGFSPFSEYLFATACEDETVGIWDLRNMSKRLHSLVGHGDKVTSVEWSPHHDGILASAGADRRVIVWDMTRIGEEQIPEDAEDAVPELVFMHGGHTSPVAEISWNPQVPWMMASVAEDNICQVWVPNRSILGKDKTGPAIADADLE